MASGVNHITEFGFNSFTIICGYGIAFLLAVFVSIGYIITKMEKHKVSRPFMMSLFAICGAGFVMYMHFKKHPEKIKPWIVWVYYILTGIFIICMFDFCISMLAHQASQVIKIKRP